MSALGQTLPTDLHVSDFAKRYDRLTALSDVSLTIRPGEVLGLIGPNGSGKTTLFECLANVLPKDRGSIFEGQRPLSAVEVTQTLFYLPDGVTPWANERVEWMLDYTIGYFNGRDDLRDAVVEWFDLQPLLRAVIGTLSKGQRKRALLALGLLTPQPVLLADEPFDGLDLRQSREVARRLRSVAQSGRTLFLSIHQINDAARVCDRFVLLSGGRVCGEGTLDELVAVSAARGGVETRDLEEVFLALT
jgi:ABC-2 type transport system ATP-binding protein